jgi:type II secretory pathway pseudopilin PulG
LAITSLIFGILSVTILPFLASVPAVIFGHVAQSKIKQSNGRVGGAGMALAGLIMGYIGVALIPMLALLAGIALPVFSSVQEKGQQTKSLIQAKEIATACRLYAVDHDGAFPKKLEELVPEYLSDPKIFICPLSPAEPIGFEYYGGKDTDPPKNVLLAGKAVRRGKQRIVVRVDTSGEVTRELPELPAHSW